ncbi:pyridoxine 5'-phosphate oxidase C-terminal domain-containing protein [Janibacter alittae]|uniref:Pyridoxine 5'-phosphate oxidase C-terminal domain-containing protein n=1 Tax=Janibacter alittae TaxID=3115209 RepID=A0ABZ2ME31_9MICO
MCRTLAARSPDARAAVGAGDWRLWHLRPTRVEHWQGSPDRRHTRVVDVRNGDDWVREVTTGSE